MSEQTIFIFNLIGGTALLMYGVDKLGDGLEKAAGNVMKKILSVLTGNLMSAFLSAPSSPPSSRAARPSRFLPSASSILD